MSPFDRRIALVLCALVTRVSRRPRAWAIAVLVIAGACGFWSASHLGINTDNIQLVDERLPFRKTYAEFAEVFPILDNALLIVVDGKTPEIAREATQDLGARLASRNDLYRDVFVPGGDPFFEEHVLLYLSVEELEELVDHLSRVQPILAALMQDPSIANLARILQQALERENGAAPSANWPEILDRIAGAAETVYEEFPIAVSWETLLLQGTPIDPVTRRVIVVEPALDFDRLLPAGRAMAGIRTAATDLGLGPESGVRIRITGNPALNHEEMVGLAWDLGIGGGACFVLVVWVLYRAFRSLRLVWASVVTLLAGLLCTAAFAALTVGHLNVVSVCFGVLFIGLGVDFAIHLGMQYAYQRKRGHSHLDALGEAAETVGPSLVQCALTTAIGFWAFLPTPYRGVAELGLIAGTGVLIALLLTLTLFPALLGSWFRVPQGRIGGADLHFHPPGWAQPGRFPGAVLAAAAGLAVVAAVLLPRSRFDANVVGMRDPSTESAQAFLDLLEDTGSSPWNAEAMAPSLDAAVTAARRLRALPLVGRVVTLADLVPDNQDEKLDILAFNPFEVVPSRRLLAAAERPSVEEQIAALRRLRDFLDVPAAEARPSNLTRAMWRLRDRIGAFLDRIDRGEQDAAAALTSLERVLLSGVPEQVMRLRRAFRTDAVTIDDLPPEIVRRMLAPDGRARIQVFPAHPLNSNERLAAFVDQVATVLPQVTGLAVNILEFGRVTVRSLREALLSALVAITAFLLALERRAGFVALVLAPLVLGALYTGGAMVAIGMPYNFVNVIVLPLLLGIGVDSGIHLVHRAEHAVREQEGLLATTTARSVFYSALTTGVSFGTLALSGHQGMASLGRLLVLGMASMLVANLVVLPALLALRRRRR